MVKYEKIYRTNLQYNYTYPEPEKWSIGGKDAKETADILNKSHPEAKAKKYSFKAEI